MLNFCRLRWSRIGILNIAGGVIAAAPVLEQAAHAVPGTPGGTGAAVPGFPEMVAQAQTI